MLSKLWCLIWGHGTSVELRRQDFGRRHVHTMHCHRCKRNYKTSWLEHR